MTALASVTIDRSGMPGSLADLVIDSEGFSSYYIDKAGFGRPGLAWDTTLATDSPWVHGSIRVAAKKRETTLPLTVRVQSDSSADLATLVDALEAALSQFVYSITVVVDGVSQAWTAYPADMQTTDGLVAFERVKAFHEDFTITIPLYPVAS